MITETNELDSTCGISDDELTRRFVEGVRKEIEESRKLGLPVALYDSSTGRAYIEYADGTREYIGAK